MSQKKEIQIKFKKNSQLFLLNSFQTDTYALDCETSAHSPCSQTSKYFFIQIMAVCEELFYSNHFRPMRTSIRACMEQHYVVIHYFFPNNFTLKQFLLQSINAHIRLNSYMIIKIKSFFYVVLSHSFFINLFIFLAND